MLNLTNFANCFSQVLDITIVTPRIGELEQDPLPHIFNNAMINMQEIKQFERESINFRFKFINA